MKIKIKNLRYLTEKLVNLGMFVSTEAVASRLNIKKSETFKILAELVLHDRSIKNADMLHQSNMEDIIWLRK